MAAAAVLLAGLAFLGCNRQPAAPEQPAAEPDKSPAQAASPTPSASTLDPRWHQPFSTATHQDPPADSFPPPDTTLAGKSTGKLYNEVVRTWDTIRFTTDAGKRLHYRAVLETDAGTIEIALRPDWAPNHVRNFVALAQVGYYDGLLFERIVHEEDDEGKTVVDAVEAGCPLGTGKLGYGSIGYWLRDELNPQAVHEEGTVGACRSFEPDTAACRFYITLGKAPTLDGNFAAFGRVTRGMDVVRTLFQQPVRRDDDDPELRERPVKPAVIRRVVIHSAVDK
jgi:peptidyl-prolyl cis-trans isomerase B (cyclophilin B)